MDWATVANLIISVGLPAAIKIVEKWEKGDAPTAAELIELEAMTNQRAKDRMLRVLATQGIDPASPQGVALLALTQ